MWFLRQSTSSQEIPLGPFVDSTDGNTQETGLSIANTDIKLLKTGGTSESSKNSGGATHIANGRYYCVLDATDTDTIGPLRVSCHVSGSLAVWLDCCVLDEAVYDVLFGTTAPSTYAGADTSGTTTLLSRIGGALTITSGRVNADLTHIAAAAVSTTTAQLGVNVVQVSGDATAADNCESFFDGTGYAGTNNVIPTVTTVGTLTTYTGNTPQTGDAFARIGAAGAGLTALGDTRLANLDATVSSRMATYPQPSGFLAATFPGGTIASTTNITAGTITTATNVTTVNGLAADVVTAAAIAADAGAEIAAAVWASATRTLTSLSGLTVDTVTTLTNLPTIPANWLTAAGTAADFTTEIQSGLATAASLATVAGYLDTEIAAILEDTGTTLPAQIAALSFSTLTAADVWAAATRTLTAGTNIALAKGTGVTGFNDLSAAQVNAEVDMALADYDPPTNAEVVARTLAAADYATAIAVGDVPTNSELATALAAADDATLAAIAALSIPTAAAIATAWGARVVGNGRTADMYLQGLTNRIEFAADGLSWTLYGADDTTVLTTGTATRLGDSVAGLRGVNPAG